MQCLKYAYHAQHNGEINKQIMQYLSILNMCNRSTS